LLGSDFNTTVAPINVSPLGSLTTPRNVPWAEATTEIRIKIDKTIVLMATQL
jgi:hypothetical protein